MNKQLKEYREKQKEKYKEIILPTQKNKNITVNIHTTKYSHNSPMIVLMIVLMIVPMMRL